ncbi:MAG TPA: hypothetical protein VLC95_11125 [Anaerolineae bacterium]|nr:hypothetical protein [Anaerolineae bacterium]
MNDRTNWREMAGTAACALLSLAAFVPLILLAGQVPLVVAVAISLACPAVWLLFLRSSRGPSTQTLSTDLDVERAEPLVVQS